MAAKKVSKKKIVKKAVNKIVKKTVVNKTAPSSSVKFSGELDYIKGLVNILDKSSLTELEIADGDQSIFLSKNSYSGGSTQTAVVAPAAAPVAAVAPVVSNVPASAAVAIDEDAGLVAIKSPTPGTFYAKPKPSEPDFVKVGDTVQKGQVVCLVEAMKNYLEVEAEVGGVVKKILASNETSVEFDQKLFLIEAN